ncbi:MAG: hypothetical protein KDA60_17520, partial [Planctomycetales bacterium]|nr:hypothetical protein [Planctomycetales bacterium]
MRRLEISTPCSNNDSNSYQRQDRPHASILNPQTIIHQSGHQGRSQETGEHQTNRTTDAQALSAPGKLFNRGLKWVAAHWL